MKRQLVFVESSLVVVVVVIVCPNPPSSSPPVLLIDNPTASAKTKPTTPTSPQTATAHFAFLLIQPTSLTGRGGMLGGNTGSSIPSKPSIVTQLCSRSFALPERKEALSSRSKRRRNAGRGGRGASRFTGILTYR